MTMIAAVWPGKLPGWLSHRNRGATSFRLLPAGRPARPHCCNVNCICRH